jgi:sugar lactone lactonase YvrE
MGVVRGRILRMAADGTSLDVFADTGGRPLGMAFDADGRLIVADALKGLLSIAADGTQTVLLRAAPDADATFPNAVTVATNGKIYFTDSSRRFSPAAWGSTQEAAMLEVLEQSASGRVLEYDPRSGHVRVVADRLCLPNGIVMSGDETQLLVSESGRYRVWRIPVAADRLDMSTQPGSAHVLLDKLPGYPDNLTRGLHGRIWLGLAGQRNMLDQLADHPFLRRMILRIPRFMWAMPKPLGHVIAFHEDGRVVADLQDPSGTSSSTTGATETAEHLYIHNVDGNRLRWLPFGPTEH